jgi:MOSC domain-containing protein YiiM
MGTVLAVCSSPEKGTKKCVVPEGIICQDFGLEGDAHADCATHRQVSLLAMESIQRMREQGFDVGPGDFAENLTTEGIDLVTLLVGTRLMVGRDVLLEVSQIGKQCHGGCAIFREVGKCIMPREGIFARVVRGGTVRAGDTIEVV